MLKGLFFTAAAAWCLGCAANAQDPVVRILVTACSLIATLIIGFLWGLEVNINKRDQE